jgi:hypothetical protein
MKTAESPKLIELRAKTDRELLTLIEKELRRAHILADAAATRESPFYQHAETILDRSTKLLPTISAVDRTEREALEIAIKDVRLALDRVPARRVQHRATGEAAQGPGDLFGHGRDVVQGLGPCLVGVAKFHLR